MSIFGVFLPLTLVAVLEEPVDASVPSTPAHPSPDDTDRDGISDAAEVAQGTDPTVHGLFPGSYPHIPEPMVFDLVRGLGASKGEFEFNTLGVANVRPYDGLAWAPEIEWAFADRHAMEFELPMHDATVEALKLAVQGTVREMRPKFIHGWQIIGEYKLEPHVFEATTLYLAGLRVSKRVSLFAMFGPRGASDGRSLHADLLFNPSVFVDVAETVTLGVETNGTVDGRASNVSIIPQMHAQLGRHFRLQFGSGVNISAQGFVPLVAFRGVIE